MPGGGFILLFTDITRRKQAEEALRDGERRIRLVTDAMPIGRDVLACGPEPMLEAVRALAPDAQLAWEAPMACGYGACYGCVVEIDGELKRLCVEGPVVCSS